MQLVDLGAPVPRLELGAFGKPHDQMADHRPSRFVDINGIGRGSTVTQVLSCCSFTIGHRIEQLGNNPVGTAAAEQESTSG